MDAVRSVMRAFFLLIALSLLAAPAQAQSTLERNAPVEGTLAAGESDTWTFTASEGEALSFIVESDSDLDPLITIQNNSGAEIIRNDDYNYPNSRDSLLEAITITRTGTYTATVTAFGDTSGDYILSMLPGFADLYETDYFLDRRAWESSGAPLVFQVNEEQAELSLTAQQTRGLVLRSDDVPADMYAEINITGVEGVAGWTAGIVTRYQSPSNYYAFMVNERGEWRFTVNDVVLRDWVTHPAIVPGRTAFSLGLMSSGSGFEFFYNDVLIGRVTDPDNTIADAGQIGLMVETRGDSNSSVNAQFDDLIITVPQHLDESNEPITPDRIVVIDSRAIVPQLQRRHLVPARGQMILTVPESFGTYNRPGVYVVPLAEGQTFRNFAIGTTVSWTADTGATVGCGLLLRTTGETEYTLAYIDQSGGYGLSQRSGDTFEPGIYGEYPPTNAQSHHLLVIADESTLTYYVDGLFAGRVENEPVDGGVGNAVVNFDPVSTSCAFTDTWLWRWD